MSRVLPLPCGPSSNSGSPVANAKLRRRTSFAIPTKGRSGSMQAASLLDDQHVAAHGACQVVGRATPDMLVNPGMSREADDQQIDGILPHEIANYPDGMSWHNYDFEVHGVQRRARPAALGKLPEVAVGAILLLA